MIDLLKMKKNYIRNQSQMSRDHINEKVASWPLKPNRTTARRCSIQIMKEPVDWGYPILQEKCVIKSVEFHFIKCANRLKGQICQKPPFFPRVQSLYSLRTIHETNVTRNERYKKRTIHEINYTRNELITRKKRKRTNDTCKRNERKIC